MAMEDKIPPSGKMNKKILSLKPLKKVYIYLLVGLIDLSLTLGFSHLI